MCSCEYPFFIYQGATTENANKWCGSWIWQSHLPPNFSSSGIFTSNYLGSISVRAQSIEATETSTKNTRIYLTYLLHFKDHSPSGISTPTSTTRGGCRTNSGGWKFTTLGTTASYICVTSFAFPSTILWPLDHNSGTLLGSSSTGDRARFPWTPNCPTDNSLEGNNITVQIFPRFMQALPRGGRQGRILQHSTFRGRVATMPKVRSASHIFSTYDCHEMSWALSPPTTWSILMKLT